MKRKVSKKVVIISVLSIVPILFLLIMSATLLSVYLTRHPVTDDELKKVSLDYAKSQCKSHESENAFCDNLYVKLGEKGEDFAEVSWPVYVYESGTNRYYAGFFVDSNDGNPKIKENSYVLPHSGVR